MNNASTQGRTLFLPCLLVFSALLLAQFYQGRNLLLQRKGLNRTTEQIEKTSAQAQQFADEMEPRFRDFLVDLLELGRTDPRARALAQQFNIKVNSPAETAETSAPKP